LGLNFLRHIERTRAIAVLVDAAPPEGDSALHYEQICHELHRYNETLLERPRIVVATKSDLSPPSESIDALRDAARQDGAAFCVVSSVSGDGLDEFVDWVGEQLPTGTALAP
jgi:GTP-binding protein